MNKLTLVSIVMLSGRNGGKGKANYISKETPSYLSPFAVGVIVGGGD
jgi:hypothetical protein